MIVKSYQAVDVVLTYADSVIAEEHLQVGSMLHFIDAVQKIIAGWLPEPRLKFK